MGRGTGSNVVDQDVLMVTVPQAAKMLEVSRNKAYELVGRKVIPSVRLDEHTIRVPVAALKAPGVGPEKRDGSAEDTRMVKVMQAAKALSLSRNKAYELVGRKVIPSVRWDEHTIRVPMVALKRIAAGLPAQEPELEARDWQGGMWPAKPHRAGDLRRMVG